MATSIFQAHEMVDAEYVLRYRYANRKDVFVGIDLIVYYGPGDETDSVVPDIFVTLDVPSYKRHIYRISEEGKAPDWVLEVASRSTYKDDVRGKKDLYESLGVGEYMVYDPEGDMHDPRLQGWVLRDGKYQELPNLERPGVEVALWSEVLGLELHFDGENLRLWDPSTANYLRRIDESERRGDIALAERDDERARREAAEEQRDIAEAQRKASEAQRKAAEEQRKAAEEQRKALDEQRKATKAKLESERAQRKAAEAKLEAEQRVRREAEQRAETKARAMEAEHAALREELRRLRSER